MPATYLLRKHLRSMELADRPEAIAERRAAKAAHERALADMRIKYPTLTADNFEDADAYRKSRVTFHLKEGGALARFMERAQS